LRGVVETTNVCRVDCDYCPMRRGNTAANDRYFLSAEEIVAGARLIRDAGIDVVLLQGGETRRGSKIVETALPMIRELFGGRVEILLNLGNLSREQYAALRAAGATSYILKHETSDPQLHRAIRHESLDTRLECLRNLLELGYRVGTGLISGLPGQPLDSIVDDIELAGDLGVHMCSVSPFVPAPDTPLRSAAAGSLDLALNALACLRICYPHLLIPSVSALEKTSAGGQASGFAAGANVMTVNFTGADDRHRYLIYGKDRFVVKMQHARNVIAVAGLQSRGSVFLDQLGPAGAGAGQQP
jgi:biotin synthase